MRIRWATIPILTLLLVPGVGAVQETKEEPALARHRTVNLSLFFPVSLNRSKQDTANVSLSLLYGHLGGVRGLDISLGAAAVEKSIEGIQLAGLAALAGESMKGFQAAGLVSVAGERGEGVQLAGLGSVAGEEFSGIQLSGLFAVAGNGLHGAQFSGLFSIAGESSVGFQGSGLFSIAGNRLDGVQLAGLFNVAGEDSRALQAAGLMNVTGGTCSGLQVGLFNVAGRLTGLQIGLVNAAGEIEGVPIGLVNITRREDRRIQLAAWLGSITFLNPGIKIWAKRFYSVLYVGGWNLPQKIEKCLGYGFQYGYAFPLRQPGAGVRKRVDVDAGYLYVDNATLFRHLEQTPDRHVLSVRGSFVIELAPRVSVAGGVGFGYRVDYGQGFGSGALFPMVFAGLELF